MNHLHPHSKAVDLLPSQRLRVIPQIATGSHTSQCAHCRALRGAVPCPRGGGRSVELKHFQEFR